MKKIKCSHCGHVNRVFITKPERDRVRQFKAEYPWVSNESLAFLLNLSTSRISEIIRADVAKRGD